MAATKKKKDGFTVVKTFRDSAEYIKDGQMNVYNVGDDVSHFDAERLEKLVERKLVEGSAKEEE